MKTAKITKRVLRIMRVAGTALILVALVLFLYAVINTNTLWSKTTDKELADNIQFSLISNTKRRDRGSLKDRLYVTAYSKMPAVLVECGFISNDEESEMLTDDKFIDKIVDGIAEGIEIYMSRNLER